MILSIESSCDDSSIALSEIDSKKLIFHRKISQESFHSEYGGVVPELASRLFARDLPLILQEMLHFCPLDLVRAVAVTNEPGLSVSLLEGIMMAKALSISRNIPLIGINHLKGHIYSLFIEKEIIKPLSVLLVSGGHTMILEFNDYEKVRIISSTIDDSFGECFDKSAKIIGLGYPGGASINNLAIDAVNNNIVDNIKFPIPLLRKDTLNFSFSGLKNAFRLEVEKLQKNENNIEISESKYLKTLKPELKQHLALALQNASVAHLLNKCRRYLKKRNDAIKHFAIVGGASSNTFLRDGVERLCDEFNMDLLLSPLEFCSDNAAMIGRAGIELYKNASFSDLNLSIQPSVIEKMNLKQYL